MATEYQLTTQDYLLIVRRHAPYLIGAFITILLISIVVAIALPPTYRSTGTILVESPQIISDKANTAQNPIEEQISHIEDRVMTRDSLLGIANKLNLFKKEEETSTTTALIEKMRDRISIELVDNDPNFDKSTKANNKPVSINRQITSIAFKLSYEDRHPEVAFQVAKDLANLFLDWNVKLRTEKASDKSAFLSGESEKLKAEVDRLNGKISDFKRQNNNFLPEQMELRSSMLARAETDLYEVDRQIQSANDELRSQQAELEVAKSSMGDQPAQELPKLKAEYARLTSIYTESHPDVKALKRKIEALEKANKTEASSNSPAPAENQMVTVLRAKVDSLQARIVSLTKQKADLKSKIAQGESALGQAPRVKGELEVLMRDRDNAQKEYEDIYSKMTNAKISTSLESENISGQFTLIEPPVLPEASFKPNRPKIFLMGLLLAIAIPCGMVLAIATFDSQIRGVDALTHLLGYPPLVVIPYLYTQDEEIHRQRNKERLIKLAKKASIAFVFALILIVIAVHFLYMPLNVLLMKILARLG